MSGILPERHRIATGATSTTTNATATLISAPDFGRLYVTAAQFGRTDANSNPTVVTLNDVAATQLVVPNPQAIGYAITYVFDTPLQFGVASAMTFKPNTALSTLIASAQGFVLE